MIDQEEMKQAEEQYSANSIQVLEGLEAVRKRPSMYIGDVSERGLHHLVYEVVDNSIDEAMAGFCDTIDVRVLEGKSIRVRDNGRGIPTGMHEKEHRSALEVVLTVLHAGGKFSKDSYKVSGGLHGVGVSCVNALADSLTAEVHREGKVFVQHYSKGKPLGPVEVTGDATDTGTIITFHPDPEIFTQTTVYRYDTLAARLRELAFLNKGIRITLTDEREMVDEFVQDESGESKATGRKIFRSEVFYSEKGLSEFIEYLDAGAQTIIPQPVCITSDKIIPIDIALQYNNGYSEKIYSYVNNIHTIEGGTHLQGFKMGLSRSLKQYAEKNKLLLCQHVDGSLDGLVAMFRKSRGACLLGCQSLWEGVDFPGDALKLLVIPKLPFPNPVDPLVAGVANKMKAEGKNAFKEFFVPEAYMELRQGLGRLIRSEEDSGKVLVLDNRIVTEHYGKSFMRIWNNKQTVVGSIDEVKASLH